MEVPVIDVGPLGDLEPSGSPGATGHGATDDPVPAASLLETASAIDSACRTSGFFSVVGHGIDPELFSRLEGSAREFFALPDATKARISMDRGGRAWRGWFPLDGELTSGVPDHKEGIYLGRELDEDDPRVTRGLPLHGPNLFPERPASLRPAVLEVMDELEALGQRLMAAIGVALGLGADHFRAGLTADPVVLMRIFHYPAVDDPGGWGVAEHTDYGLLTLLHQDHTGGLEVRMGDRWTEVPPLEGSLVCNLGDMLERMTAGRYRATPHRVRVPDADRVSIPFFFDPGWDAPITELPLAHDPAEADPPRRWDGTDLRTLTGTYGDYLVSKVARVFPELGREQSLTDREADQ